MDTNPLREVYDLYDFPPGRAAYAAKQTHAVADELGDAVICAACRDTVAVSEQAIQREQAWATSRVESTRGRYSPAAVGIDEVLDRTVTGLFELPAQLARALDPDAPLALQAAQFRTQAFPEGPFAYTGRSFPEQAFSMGELLRRLRDGDLVSYVAPLGLGPLVERLATLLPRFEAELAKQPAAQRNFAEVEQARVAVNDSLLVLVARICGSYATDRPTLARLLAPILRQQEDMRALRRRHRTVVDVNPANGEPVEPLVIEG